MGLLTRIEGVPDEIGRLHARVAASSASSASASSASASSASASSASASSASVSSASASSASASSASASASSASASSASASSAAATRAVLSRLRLLAWCSRVLARVLPLSMGLGGAVGVAVVAWLDGSRVLGVLAFFVAGVLAVSAAMMLQLGLLLIAVRGSLRALATAVGDHEERGSAGGVRAR